MAPIAPHSSGGKHVDARLFRDVMGRFATGVTVATYCHDGQALGMTANAFMSVSLVPPLAALSVRRQARFAAAVRVADHFGVSFLAAGQEALSNHFGGRPVADRAPGFETCMGVPILAGSLAQIVLRVVAVHEAGDHLLYIGEVQHLRAGSEQRPLVFYNGTYKHVTVHHIPQFFWVGDKN